MKNEQERQLEVISAIHFDVRKFSEGLDCIESIMYDLLDEFELEQQLKILNELQHNAKNIKTKIYAIESMILNSSMGLELKQLLQVLNQLLNSFKEINPKLLYDLKETVYKLSAVSGIRRAELKNTYRSTCSIFRTLKKNFQKYVLKYLVDTACKMKNRNSFEPILEYLKMDHDEPIYLFYSEDDWGDWVMNESNIKEREYEILYEDYRKIENQVADKYDNEKIIVHYDGKLFSISRIERDLTYYDYDRRYEMLRETVVGVTKVFCLEFLENQSINI